MTNEHIVNNSIKCDVLLNSKEKMEADIIWSDSKIDLAIIKVNKQFDSYFIMTESNELKLGQEVYAIGNPISSDFEKTVTKGIISGLNRNLYFEEENQSFYIKNLIQTDAVINNGNSGGALINASGHLIGITTIKITSAESMSFAVPIDLVKSIIEKLDK